MAAIGKVIRRDWQVWAAIAIPLVLLVYVHLHARFIYWRITVDWSRQEAISRLGEPDKVADRLMFCDGFFDWSGGCPSRRHSEYLFFRKGIDRWIVLGLDHEGRVVYKTIGDL